MQKSFKILFYFLVLVMGCEKNPGKKSGYFTDINPDKVLHKNESFPIDMDKDEILDFLFSYNHSFPEISQLDDSYQVCAGSALGSGGYPFDTIGFNEIIDYPLNWHSSYYLYQPEIEYLGVRKNTSSQALFGWIKIELSDSSIIIKEHYLSNDPDNVVRAGISD